MTAGRDKQTYGFEEDEHCPECSHTWHLEGPAHFTDCRYFSLDDGRDEEFAVCLWVTGREGVSGQMQEAAA